MTTAAVTGTDVNLRNRVVRELDWDPDVDDSAIGVAAKGGVVTLTGFIGTYAGKLAAERVAKRVRGVRAVANDITVRLRVDRTDADIAADALSALRLRSDVPDTVQVTVHQGHVTLTGRVEWFLQRQRAEAAVGHVRGIRGVHNHIDVPARTTRRDVRHRIVQALHRNANVDARHIDVTVDNDVVTLTGTVGSWTQRDAAELAAGSAPGIRLVTSHLTVEPLEPCASFTFTSASLDGVHVCAGNSCASRQHWPSCAPHADPATAAGKNRRAVRRNTRPAPAGARAVAT